MPGKVTIQLIAMPDLEQTLQGHDLGFLKMVAGAWGIELNAPDTVTALPIIVQQIIEHADFGEIVEALPKEAKEVLAALVQNEGRLPWASFVRKYGDLRRMGSARRDRERPDRKPASAVEVLWYRGLIGRAFFDASSESEPQEYAYIPEDILPLLPALRGSAPLPLGRPATPAEAAYPIPATDSILDHACTLLAALRIKMDEASLARLDLGGIPFNALNGLLKTARLLDCDGLPHAESTRAFLEASRGKALAQLAQAWMDDKYFNELRLLPGLRFEGEWNNDPLQARKAILELVSQIPENRWWSLSAFISAIHEQNPDFQRPAGDYDSWFIRKESSGNYLRGFNAWNEVDGALVRFLITGPLHWLGFVDLATNESAPGQSSLKSLQPTALHLSQWAPALWHGETIENLPREDAKIQVSKEGRLVVPARAPRAVRYQIARFCSWDGEEDHDGQVNYRYHLTPAALDRARVQGLRAGQLLGLLRRHCENPLPPTLIQALERWESNGAQALIEKVVVLRVTTPEIIAALRKTGTARWLGESLNETSILIRPGMEEQVRRALIEIGYLAEAKLETSTKI
jgi:hypothetical protein